MAKSKKEITTVTWATDDQDLLLVNYSNGEAEYCSLEENNQLYKDVRKKFTLANITKETENFKLYLTEREQRFLDFNNHYEEWRAFKNGRLNIDTTTDLTALNDLINLADNKQEFFKLKLQIFELDNVKSSKDRTWKSAMRKAKTSLELLALLYQGMSDPNNEQDEPLGEIPLQDITNQENTQDSVQDSDGQSSDAPTE